MHHEVLHGNDRSNPDLKRRFLFVVSAYISMMVQSKEDDVHEEIFLLHGKSIRNYYISRELVMYSISFLYAIILIVYPIIRSIRIEGFFTRPLEAEDVLFGSLLVIGNGMCGIATGDFFHHRIITRRRNGIIGVGLVSVLALCKAPIIQRLSFMKVLNLLLPPLTDGFSMVGDGDIFNPGGTLNIFIHSIIYVLVIIFIKLYLLRRRRFG